MTIITRRIVENGGLACPLLKGYKECVAKYKVFQPVKLCPSPTTSLNCWYTDDAEEVSKNGRKTKPAVQILQPRSNHDIKTTPKNSSKIDCSKIQPRHAQKNFFLMILPAPVPSRTPMLVVKMLINFFIPCETPTLCKHQKDMRAT